VAQPATRVRERLTPLGLKSFVKAQRRGKVFIDCLRNNRGSTSVSALSTRVRPGALVSMPIAWDAVAKVDPATFTVKTVPGFLAQDDPWKGYAEVRQRFAPASRTRAPR
jgi:bifunctional non-homologous end joining protein LigD